MKKIIFIFMSLIIMSGCYSPDETTGVYTVISDSAVSIYYTDGEGNTRESFSPGGEWVYTVTVKEDHSPDPFLYSIKAVSQTGPQNISILGEFAEQGNIPIPKEGINVSELEFNSYFCASWSTQCAKVTIHF